jgi:Relaxase/Mobilisation nuclease domain
MPKRITDAYRPLFDIASYARRGPGRRDRLSPAEVQQIARTVGRTPEVMVKVLSGGGQDLGAVGRHLAYLGRAGELDLEADDGERLQGKGTEKALLEDWDLDLDSDRRQADLSAANGRQPPKLVHKLMFSMPPGTPPDKLQAAVRNLAREEFALKHRYVMVLHTDEPHPHVHMVVKAVSEQGVRLNIRKQTLRDWRREFARHLREQGVAANATERVVRGETRTPKKDGIYRAMRRGDSSHMRNRVHEAAAVMGTGRGQAECGKSKLIATSQKQETPRLCRGGSRSLTVPEVHH